MTADKDNHYWKMYWDSKGRHAGSNFVMDRGTTVRLDVVERRAVKQLLSAINPQPGDRILDAGCGTGANIALLASKVSEIVGVDFSETVLARAHERLSQEKIKNAQLVLGSVKQLPFPSNSFHKVVCASVLQYLNDVDCDAAIGEMIRVCSHQGTIVLHVKNRTSLYGASLFILKAVLRAFGKNAKPDCYRPRAWYEDVVNRRGGVIADYDSLGIFTFEPAPIRITRLLLDLEMKLVRGRWLRRFGVNFKMTISVKKLNGLP